MKYLAIVLFLSVGQLVAQQIKPKGQFLQDSIKIGIPVPYSLSLKYPREMDIVFPDSLYTYAPYELDKKIYIPTKSDAEFSYDSAVYYLTSFEIDSVQYFKLPVIVLHGRDSTLIYTETDSVVLQQLVADIPDSVAVESMPLKENTNFINVPLQFNYPYFIIGAIILGVLTILVIIFFGKPIRKYFQLKRLEKNHVKFIEKFDQLSTQNNSPQSKLAEAILVHWKRYLENLEKQPYTKLTTKEIISRYDTKEIADSLKEIDQTIYANMPFDKLKRSLTAIKKYSQKKYEQVVEEVKHG